MGRGVYRRMRETQQYLVGNGLINAIWRLMSEDGLKDAIRRSVDCIRDSFARTRTPVVEEDFAGECSSLF